jgi:polyhydroxyalkanoate synthesis regulator phasin
MELFEYFRRMMLAGFGMQDKVKELVDELVKKGELSESQGARFVKELSEKAQKSTVDVNQMVSDLTRKSMEKMNIPARDDLDALAKKVDALAKRVKRLEERSSEKG